MTPVDAARTLDASIPSAAATARSTSRTSRSPSGPASAFALPLFTTMARIPLARKPRLGVAHGGGPRRVHGEAPGGGARRVAVDERHVLAGGLDAAVDARRTEIPRGVFMDADALKLRRGRAVSSETVEEVQVLHGLAGRPLEEVVDGATATTTSAFATAPTRARFVPATALERDLSGGDDRTNAEARVGLGEARGDRAGRGPGPRVARSRSRECRGATGRRCGVNVSSRGSFAPRRRRRARARSPACAGARGSGRRGSPVDLGEGVLLRRLPPRAGDAALARRRRCPRGSMSPSRSSGARARSAAVGIAAGVGDEGGPSAARARGAEELGEAVVRAVEERRARRARSRTRWDTGPASRGGTRRRGRRPPCALRPSRGRVERLTSAGVARSTASTPSALAAASPFGTKARSLANPSREETCSPAAASDVQNESLKPG